MSWLSATAARSSAAVSTARRISSSRFFLPSTRRKDVTIKLNKYIAAGVREYWIIDPDQCRVLVYDFSAAIYPVIYGFDRKIPVAIWDGDCVIDFQEVYDYIYFLYEKDPNPPQ